MWSFLLIGLLVATVIVLVGVNLRQRRSIETLRRAREELQVEEDRVFDFLHGLGEAFSEDLRSSDLHRLIVEGRRGSRTRTGELSTWWTERASCWFRRLFRKIARL
jgi:hypothetical protein